MSINPTDNHSLDYLLTRRYLLLRMPVAGIRSRKINPVSDMNRAG